MRRNVMGAPRNEEHGMVKACSDHEPYGDAACSRRGGCQVLSRDPRAARQAAYRSQPAVARGPIAAVRVHASSTASDTDGGWSEIVLNPARRVNLLEAVAKEITDAGGKPPVIIESDLYADDAGALRDVLLSWWVRSHA